MQHFSHVSAFYYGGFIIMGQAGHTMISNCHLDASRDYWEASIDRRCYAE